MSDHRDRVYLAYAAFMAELAAAGVAEVVVSPGSRSTPLTLSADARPDLRIWIQLDERAAGFFALGLAKATERPVALICTSGTAAANYLPAVAEAYFAGVPLIVLTADRPPELRGWGAGQTIDQPRLYGSHVRWSTELPAGESLDPDVGRRIARRAVSTARGPAAGPVHLNAPFREPLEPPDGGIPVAEAVTSRPDEDTVRRLGPEQVEHLTGLVRNHRHGVIAAGPADFDAVTAAAVGELSRISGWPILADAASQLRRGRHVSSAPVIGTADHLLRTGFADHAPEVVLRIGATPVSKALRLWLERHRPGDVVVADAGFRWNEPSFTSTRVLGVTARALAEPVNAALGGDSESSEWASAWFAADRTADRIIAEVLDAGPLLEAGVARIVTDSVPEGATVFASNSMPVRDLEGFLRTDPSALRVAVNRGANGIDGIVSSALGLAAGSPGAPVVALAGDLAVLHDASGLLAGARLGLDLTLVVPNNDGGGIFSFLPIAERADAIDTRRLFHTPHGVDLADLAAAARARHHRVTTADDLATAVEQATRTPGVDVIEIPIDVEANVAQHQEIVAAVDAAV